MTTNQTMPITFMRGVTGEKGLLQDRLPQVVMAGRSNVGKSSVINSLAQSQPARAAKKPGKTTEMNFYNVGDRGYLVDLPGFGYAKLSAKKAEKMRKQMLWYLVDSGAQISCVVLVIDVRRGVGDKEQDLIAIAEGERLPLLIVANKADKCNQSELHEAKQKIINATETLHTPPDILLYSAKTGKGTDMLADFLTQIYG